MLQRPAFKRTTWTPHEFIIGEPSRQQLFLLETTKTSMIGGTSYRWWKSLLLQERGCTVAVAQTNDCYSSIVFKCANENDLFGTTCAHVGTNWTHECRHKSQMLWQNYVHVITERPFSQCLRKQHRFIVEIELRWSRTETVFISGIYFFEKSTNIEQLSIVEVCCVADWQWIHLIVFINNCIETTTVLKEKARSPSASSKSCFRRSLIRHREMQIDVKLNWHRTLDLRHHQSREHWECSTECEVAKENLWRRLRP